MKKSHLWLAVALVASLFGMVLFMPSAGASPGRGTSTATVCFAGDEGWDFSASSEKWPTEVKTTQFTDAGLVLDLAQAPRAGGKQAGYKAVTDSLYNAAKYEANGKLGFQYGAVFGPLPGYQLLIDLDNDLTTYDGILVGESVYGNKWWATKVDKFPLIPDSTGGGSVKSATLQEFLDKYPTAKIYGVGFSLGSGVTGYGTLSAFQFGNQAWQFTKYCGPGATTSTSPTPTSTTTVPPTSTTTTVPATSTTTGTTAPALYENCTDVWETLGRPIKEGEDGFSAKLDENSDGVGCETDPRNGGVVPVGNLTSSPRVPAATADLASTGTPFNPWIVGGLALIIVASGGLAIVFARRRPIPIEGGDNGDE